LAAHLRLNDHDVPGVRPNCDVDEAGGYLAGVQSNAECGALLGEKADLLVDLGNVAHEVSRPEPLYERLCDEPRTLCVPVETGVFGALMDVELVNDGPVTIVVKT
jgi:D-Tyr-tRNA(Tyr) deacylase